MNELDERLKHLEELLRLILIKLNKIEELLLKTNSSASEEIKLASSIMISFSIPAIRALELASKAIKLAKSVNLVDEITISILLALLIKGRATISELTRTVRKIRGKASRRIITERLKKLEESNIVKLDRKGTRTWVSLTI